MQLRLTYEGPLRSSQGDPRDGQDDRRAPHKHELRKHFHQQLRYFWDTHPFLSKVTGGYDIFNIPRPDDYPKRLQDEPLLRDNLAKFHEVNGRRFVPLVCAEMYLLCSLNVLMLRRDRPGHGSIFDSRDLDNRLKTLFDALKMPRNAGEMAGCDFADDEDPMFVLVQDDKLITQVSLETDDLLNPPSQVGHDDSFVRLLVTVEIKPWQTTMFNLSFG